MINFVFKNVIDWYKKIDYKQTDRQKNSQTGNKKPPICSDYLILSFKIELLASYMNFKLENISRMLKRRVIHTNLLAVHQQTEHCAASSNCLVEGLWWPWFYWGGSCYKWWLRGISSPRRTRILPLCMWVEIWTPWIPWRSDRGDIQRTLRWQRSRIGWKGNGWNDEELQTMHSTIQIYYIHSRNENIVGEVWIQYKSPSFNNRCCCRIWSENICFDQGVPEGTCSQVLRSTSIDS